VGGLSDTYTVVGFGEAYGAIDLKLEPLGAYRRYLARRFAEQVGLSPKRAARGRRFADVRRRFERAPSQWAQIASEAG
jgi:AraC-like DNA-binding protein